MARHGYWLCEYVSISRILKKARGQYARSYLYTETDENDLTYFILYQMRVLLRAVDELHEYLARKAAELDEAEEIVRRAHSPTTSSIHGNLLSCTMRSGRRPRGTRSNRTVFLMG